MARLLPLMLTLAAVLGFAACGGGGTHEALAKESISTLREFGDTLAKVTDKASAEAHVKDLDKLGAKIKDLHDSMQKLGTPLDKALEVMTENLEVEMNAVMAKVNKELGRIAMNPELKSVIGPVLERMGKWR